MSGPQMVGVGVTCRFRAPTAQPQQCAASSGVGLLGKTRRAPAERFWWSLGGAVYTSTGKNAGSTDYRAWENWMVAVEPMLELRSRGTEADNLRVYHGVAGLTLNYLFRAGLREDRNAGPTIPGDYDSFFNWGVKVTPIELEYRRFSVGANVRWYPDGVSADQFGVGAEFQGDRPSEFTYGVSVGWVIWRKE